MQKGIVFVSFGTNNDNRRITKIASDMTLYPGLNNPTKFIAVLRFSENYKYFDALIAEDSNYLRGYKKYCFPVAAGIPIMEFRLKLFKSNSYIVPGQLI